MKRGEVWLCALDPTVGSEIQKTRPCLVVSPDDLNQRLQTAIVVPMTSGGRVTPFRVQTRFRETDGLLVPDQMRALDRRRFRKRLGEIDAAALTRTLTILGRMFDA